MSAPDQPPEQTMDHGYAFKKYMSHADECVRLAGLTDDLMVRDRLLHLAQGWMRAAWRARRPSDDTRVVSLHKNLGDNVVPLHTTKTTTGDIGLAPQHDGDTILSRWPWLLAIGQGLQSEYSALKQPVEKRLVARLKKLRRSRTR